MSSSHFITAGGFRQARSESQDHDSKGAAIESRTPCPESDPVLLGDSVAVRRLRSQIQRVAPYFRTALIRGETGSGKQLVARAIHSLSPAADGPFIVSCASTLAESVASCDAGYPGYTPAGAAAVLESVHGGTLYLNEVGELSSAQQGALFRFLSIYEGQRLGPAQTRRTSFDQFDRRGDTRIVAASDRDLRALSAVGSFRQDLYTRLSVVEIVVPPLRQRIEDIPLLAAWLLRRLAAESGQTPKRLAEATLSQLQDRLWPGNLSELERVVAQAAELSEGMLIEPRHLLALVEPASSRSTAPPPAKIARLHDVVQQHVLEVLTRCGGNKLHAAEVLGISRSTLYRMLDAKSAARRAFTE
jgi:DNA-binding NtrC family response regulator